MPDYYNISQPWNMSQATLMRMNDLIKKLSTEQVNRRFLLVYRYLEELHKEVYPHLTDQQKKEVVIKWSAIQVMCPRTTNNGKILFNNDLIPLLNDMDLWLREKLKDRGLLMAGGDNVLDAFLDE